jgi:hypothetical protein
MAVEEVLGVIIWAGKLISNGVVEGPSNRAKVTMRSYGFRTCRALELALYYSLGKLPRT